MKTLTSMNKDYEIMSDTEKEILKISANAKAGKDVSPQFTDIDAAIDWLAAEMKKVSK